jgi:hypothetical protein
MQPDEAEVSEVREKRQEHRTCSPGKQNREEEGDAVNELIEETYVGACGAAVSDVRVRSRKASGDAKRGRASRKKARVVPVPVSLSCRAGAVWTTSVSLSKTNARTTTYGGNETIRFLASRCTR